MAQNSPAWDYPVRILLEPQIEGRNRRTTLLRWILAIPHFLLVGAGTIGSNGVLATVAQVCAVISWFAILFTGKEPRGLWDLRCMVLRWRFRVMAYALFLRDEYPPLGDGDYPATVSVDWPDRRDRLSVALRLVFVIPHIIVLLFLGVAAAICALLSWFAILFTGRLPAGLAGFIRNVGRSVCPG